MSCDITILCGINLPFERLFPSMRQVTHVLLTRPPLIHFPKETSSLDLHVLGTPPAFVLSQDQTLNKKFNLCSYSYKRIAGLLNCLLYSVQFSKTNFLCRPQATHLVYHLARHLSTTFFTFFQVVCLSVSAT